MSPVDARLWDAVRSGKVDAIRAAVAAGGNLDLIQNYKYPTPLIWVAMHGDSKLELLKELVSLGATLNLDISGACPYRQYENAFDAALWQDQYKAASMLIDMGADMNMDPSNFSQFLSGDKTSIEQVALAKKMFDGGAYCDEEILAGLKGPYSCGELTFMDGYWEDGALKMGDVLEQWMRERDEKNAKAGSA